MSHRFLIFIVSMAVVGMGMLATPAVGQTTALAGPDKPESSYVPPKTIYGQPDLEGVWSFYTLTPFGRPKEFADKPFFTEAEALAFEQRRAEGTPCGSVDIGRPCNPDFDETPFEQAGQLNSLAYDNSFFDAPAVSLTRTRRTSQVIDPPDGRVPPLTPEAKERYAAAPTFDEQDPAKLRTAEDLQLHVRCIGFHHAPPIRVSPYDNFIQIVLGRDAVVINGLLHTYQRVVPTDGRPHLPPTVRQWWGDSRGRWEGNTLVIETTNFTNAFSQNVYGADEHLHLVERFTRVEPDLLLYEYTVDNPTAFTKPWTVAYYMKKTEDTKVYPYTCIEANRAPRLILGGARAAEEAAEAAPTTNAQ